MSMGIGIMSKVGCELRGMCSKGIQEGRKEEVICHLGPEGYVGVHRVESGMGCVGVGRNGCSKQCV